MKVMQYSVPREVTVRMVKMVILAKPVSMVATVV